MGNIFDAMADAIEKAVPFTMKGLVTLAGIGALSFLFGLMSGIVLLLYIAISGWPK